MRVSVVIPSFNAQDTIRRCLTSIRKQSDPPDEVVVVDSSTDETPNIVRDEFPEVRLLGFDKRLLSGEARNTGVAAADGSHIAFIDTDCEASPDWLRSFVEVASKKGVGGIVGSICGPPGESWVAQLDRSLQFTGFEPKRSPRWIAAGASCNLFLEKTRLLKLGGFPDTPRAEDAIVCRRYLEAYGRLWFEPGARVAHLSPDDLKEVLARQRKQGAGFPGSRAEEPRLRGALALRYPLLIPFLSLTRMTMSLWRLTFHDRELLAVVVRHPGAWLQCHAQWTRALLEAVGQDSGRGS